LISLAINFSLIGGIGGSAGAAGVRRNPWNRSASSVSPLIRGVYGVGWWLVGFYPVPACREWVEGGEDEVAAGGVGSG